MYDLPSDGQERSYPEDEGACGRRGEALAASAIRRLLGEERQSVFSYYRRLEKLRDHVCSNLDGDLGLGPAARVVAMEKSAFSRFFRSKVGINYSDWIRRARLAGAIELMARGNCSMLEISLAVGFQEKRTFERTFKKYLQTTPGRFKRRIRPDGNGMREV